MSLYQLSDQSIWPLNQTSVKGTTRDLSSREMAFCQEARVIGIMRSQMNEKVKNTARHFTSKMFGGRGAIKACNFVHKDEIWKDHVKMELVAQRRWPEKWGFLAETYRKLEESLNKIGDEIPPDSPSKDDTDLVHKAAELSKLHSGKPRFPTTDSELIGWRLQYKSPISQNILKHAGKTDVIKQLGWPREGL